MDENHSKGDIPKGLLRVYRCTVLKVVFEKSSRGLISLYKDRQVALSGPSSMGLRAEIWILMTDMKQT